MHFLLNSSKSPRSHVPVFTRLSAGKELAMGAVGMRPVGFDTTKTPLGTRPKSHFVGRRLRTGVAALALGAILSFGLPVVAPGGLTQASATTCSTVSGLYDWIYAGLGYVVNTRYSG